MKDLFFEDDKEKLRPVSFQGDMRFNIDDDLNCGLNYNLLSALVSSHDLVKKSAQNIINCFSPEKRWSLG